MTELHIENVIDRLRKDIVTSVNRSAAAGEEFSNGEIQNVIATVTRSFVGYLDMHQHMEILANVPDAASMQVEMPDTSVKLGRAIASSVESVLLALLEPLRRDLFQQNYVGQVVPLLVTVGATATALAETPASRLIKKDDVDRFRAVVDEFVAEQLIPTHPVLCEIMEIGVRFFFNLRTALEIRELGEPVGITEESVGFQSVFIKGLSRKMSDVYQLNLMPETSEIFRSALIQELSWLPEAPTAKTFP